LSNGYKFKFIYASGALGFDGNGWMWEKPLIKFGLIPTNIPIITKTLTLKRKKGNPLAIRFIKNGVKNKIGLDNPGIEYWIKNIYPKVNKNIIVSIFGEIGLEYMTMIYMLDDLNIKGIELNISCPNRDYIIQNNSLISLLGAIKSKHPLLIKVNNRNNLDIFKNKIIQEKVEAISINSISIQEKTEITNIYSQVTDNYALSGKTIFPLTCSITRQIKTLCNIPTIYSSVWNLEDYKKAINSGADAISFGSILLRYPLRIKKIINVGGKNET
jgi:dihydroorotate dehydrogenase (NAD+) catalytic subunit